MTTKLNHLKLMTCIILILAVISVLRLQAQDYLISFTGSGASSTVDSVIVENLTQGTILKMKGSDDLHLKGVVTGIDLVRENATGKIDFYPNPMQEYARMQFVLPEPGETMITFYDLSGRQILQTRNLLSTGQHTYSIKGIKEGVYFARISSGKYSYSGRLISSGSKKGVAKIVCENTMAIPEKQIDSKGTNEEKVMQYTTGNRLKLTGISGIYSTVITDVPAEGKTITFNFITCTDGDNNNYPVVVIGTQTWMAANLKTTKYSNGESIATTSSATDNVFLADTYQPECTYQWAYAGNESYVPIYGRLYTFYAVKDTRNICPTGWHVPLNTEWTALQSFLGGANEAGKKLMETGVEHWPSPNADATDEFGFTAIAGGRRDRYGPFDYINVASYWWSSTTMTYNYIGYAWSIAGTNKNLSGYTTNAIYGFYVRCLKDN